MTPTYLGNIEPGTITRDVQNSISQRVTNVPTATATAYHLSGEGMEPPKLHDRLHGFP